MNYIQQLQADKAGTLASNTKLTEWLLAFRAIWLALLGR
jgi:hypothetical protein